MYEGGRFSAATRRDLLEREVDLPTAARRPPHRCVNELLLTRLGDANGVLLESVAKFQKQHKSLLMDIARNYIESTRRRWPRQAVPKSYSTMVKQTLLGKSKKMRYSMWSLLHTLRWTRERGGFDGLCARDHYSEREPVVYTQLNVALILMDQMDKAGALLPLEPEACPICREPVAAWGTACHLEPCRHWVCARCSEGYMQERCQDTCPLCRTRVAEYVEVSIQR